MTPTRSGRAPSRRTEPAAGVAFRADGSRRSLARPARRCGLSMRQEVGRALWDRCEGNSRSFVREGKTARIVPPPRSCADLIHAPMRGTSPVHQLRESLAPPPIAKCYHGRPATRVVPQPPAIESGRDPEGRGLHMPRRAVCAELVILLTSVFRSGVASGGEYRNPQPLSSRGMNWAMDLEPLLDPLRRRARSPRQRMFALRARAPTFSFHFQLCRASSSRSVSRCR
jgi:hypothetical protein